MGVSVSFKVAGQKVEGDQIATNSGWVEFGEWVESLLGEFPTLLQFWREGHCGEVKRLREEIARAVQQHGPSAPVGMVARAVVAEIDRHKRANRIAVH